MSQHRGKGKKKGGQRPLKPNEPPLDCVVCLKDLSTIPDNQQTFFKGKHYHNHCLETVRRGPQPAPMPFTEGATLEDAADVIGEKYEEGKEIIGEKYEEGKEIIGEKYEAAKKSVGDTIENIKQTTLYSDIVQEGGKKLEEVKEVVGRKAEEYKEDLAKRAEDIKVKATEAAKGARESIGKAVEGAREGVQQIPVKMGELKQQAEEGMAELKEDIGNKAEDIHEVTTATFGEMGETVGDTVEMIKAGGYQLKEAAEERAMYAKEEVESRMENLRNSFAQFKDDYDNFKIEAAQGHGLSFFDQATTAVSDLAAWLTGELEYPEEEEGYVSEEEGGSNKMIKGGIEGKGKGGKEDIKEEEEVAGSGQEYHPATSTVGGGGKNRKGKKNQ